MALYSNKFVPSNDPRLKRNPFVMTATPFQSPTIRTGNFGQGINLPGQTQLVNPPPPTMNIGSGFNPAQMPGQASIATPPPGPKPFSFTDEYDKLNANRPNRLAYQQAIESGPPEINRGKWAKLGAMIAAGGSALGGTRAPEAAQFGINAYKMPQQRSDELYNKRVAGLAQLAQFEDSDMRDKITALDKQKQYEQQDRENRRQLDKDWEEKIDAGQRREANAQAIDDAKYFSYDDPRDGMRKRIRKDGTGVAQVLGKTGWSADEATDNEVKAAVAKYQALRPFQKSEDLEKFMRDVYLKKMDQDAAQTKQNTINATQIAKAAAYLRSKAGAALKDDPNSMYGRVLTAMTDAVSRGELPPDAAGYIKYDNGMMSVDAGWTGDQAVVDKLNSMIQDAYAGKLPAGGTITPAAGNTQAASGTVTPPAASAEPPYSFTPTATHTIKMVNPDGKEFYSTPQNIEMFKKDGAKVIDAPGIPKPGGGKPEAKNETTPNPPGAALAASVAPNTTGRLSNFGVGTGWRLPQGTPNANPINRVAAQPLTNPIQLSKPANPAPSTPFGLMGGMRPQAPQEEPKVEFDNKLQVVKDKVKAETGLDLTVISKERTPEQQAALFSKGRDAQGKKVGATVTNADGTTKKSKHQTGEAADLRFIDASGKVIEGDEKLWAILGRIAKEQGLTWGGDWKDPYDPLHIQR